MKQNKVSNINKQSVKFTLSWILFNNLGTEMNIVGLEKYEHTLKMNMQKTLSQFTEVLLTAEYWENKIWWILALNFSIS